MNLSVEVLHVLLYLTPGLFATIVLDAILVRKDRDAALRIAEALVLSLIIYGVASLFIESFPVSIVTDRDAVGKVAHTSLVLRGGALIPVLILSILVPLSIGHLFTAQWLMRMFRRLRLTGRTGREGQHRAY